MVWPQLEHAQYVDFTHPTHILKVGLVPHYCPFHGRHAAHCVNGRFRGPHCGIEVFN